MKIYFAGSIRGGRGDSELYAAIIAELTKYGEVLTEHLGDALLSKHGENKPAAYVYSRDIEWLTAADIVVAEVTTPSLGVGYEIAKAEELKKKMLCLFRPSTDKSLSAMITGNAALLVREYATLIDIQGILKDFFKN